MLGFRRLALAASLVFAAHVVFLFLVPPLPLAADALIYHELGRRIAGGLGYTLGGRPLVDLMPGYPLFIAAFYTVFGPHPWLIRIAQAACVAIAAAVLSVLVQRRWGPTAGRIAFLAIALLPAWFIYPGTLNAESLLLAVEVGFLAIALHQPPRLGYAAASGVV